MSEAIRLLRMTLWLNTMATYNILIMGKKHKRVKTLASVPDVVSKIPKTESQANFYSLNPAWRISRLEMCAPFGWHKIEKEKLVEVCSKLGELEASTWNEIFVTRKKQNHTVSVSKLCKEAKDRLKELRLDEHEELISLRLSGIERVWGYQYLDALALLWWDPEHQICPSLLKNT